jgi:redox-sensitive bicupin YhaK (pirin superfamily)
VKDVDPFLMLDAFDSVNPGDYVKGFPWHPHRGIETITYLIQGDIEHEDSLNNKGRILDGGCQWMTAGSGIIHQEMPQQANRLLGAQLWLNLPAKDKMVPPNYRDLSSDTIPIIEEGKTRVHIIAGNYKGTAGAAQGDYVKPLYLDVELKPESEWALTTERDATLFIYIIKGQGHVNQEAPEHVEEKKAVVFNEGETFWVKAADKGMRFLLLSGKPLNEPIAWGGPIVMNTNEELELALKEIDEGTFIKQK